MMSREREDAAQPGTARAPVTSVPSSGVRARGLERVEDAEPREDPHRLGAHVLGARLVAREGGAVDQRDGAAGAGRGAPPWRCPAGPAPTMRTSRLPAQSMCLYSKPSSTRTSEAGPVSEKSNVSSPAPV